MSKTSLSIGGGTKPKATPKLPKEFKGKKVVLLVDADIVAYRSASATDGKHYIVGSVLSDEPCSFQYKKQADAYCDNLGIDKKAITMHYAPEPIGHATYNIGKIIGAMHKRFSKAVSLETEFYLTPKATFRDTIITDYKANRKGMHRPANLDGCKGFIENELGGKYYDGYEADDVCLIRANELANEPDTIPVMCSIDKDFKQQEGWHYNFVKDELTYVSEKEANLYLYKQLLTGDKVDNIPGLKGVGPKTADKLLDGSVTAPELFAKCLTEYTSRTPRLKNEDDTEFLTRVLLQIKTNMAMLYLLRSWDDQWRIPL